MGIDFAAFFRALASAFGRPRPPVLPQRRPSPAPVEGSRTVAVVTPIPDAHVVLETVPPFEGVTNTDGYLAFQVPTSITATTVTIDAVGCQPYRQAIDLPPTNIDVRIGLPAGSGPTLLLPPLEPSYVRRDGVVLLQQRTFLDKGGVYLPFGVSLFWAFWAYQHDRDKLIRHLIWLADHRVDYIRVFTVIGPTWIGRVIDPRTSDWDHDLAGFLGLVYGQYGLRVELTIWQDTELTPSMNDRQFLIDRLALVIMQQPNAIQYVEICNEGYAHTERFPSDWPAEARALSKRLKLAIPHPVAVTSPGGMSPAEVIRWYGDSTANLMTAHLPRDVVGGGETGAWRYVRQTWDPWLTSTLAWTNDEGKGPQSSLAEDDDPLRLTMYAALTWLCGGAGFVLHTGAGVSGDGERGRAENLWDVSQIETTLAGIRASRRLLPPDLPNWTRHNASTRFPNYPYDPVGVGAQDNGNMLRAFAATRDGQVVCMPILIEAPAQFVPKWNLHTDVHDPLTGELLESHDGAFTLTPRGAAILIGRPL